MIALSTPELVVACAAVTLGYGVFGLIGFGANIVALPVLAHVMSLRVAVPTLLVLDLISASLLSTRHRASVDTAELKRLVLPLLLGMGLGLPVLQHAAERWLLMVLGIFLGLYAGWSLLSAPRRRIAAPGWAWPAGLTGGVFSTVFGTGGPLYTLFLAHRITDMARLRATLATVILGAALTRLALLGSGGFLTQPGLLALAAVLVPCALAGYAAGSLLHTRIPQERLRRVLWGLLLLAAVSLVVRAAWGV